MKKNLLLASMLMAGATMFAAVDPATYSPMEGYTLTNLWQNCAANNGSEWSGLVGGTIASENYIPTAVALGDKIYVGSSKDNVILEDGTSGMDDLGCLHVFNFNTGAYEKTIALTKEDGTRISGLLCVNTIDVDNFGNLFVAGYRASMWNADTNEPNPIEVYKVNPENGACTLVASLAFTSDDSANSGRVDYIDVVGDITRENARCVVMCAVSAGSEKIICGWEAEQGATAADAFTGHLVGGEYITLGVEESYPESGNFTYSTSTYILSDDEFSGELFYVDDFATKPALYNTEGTMLASFRDVVEADPENPVLQPTAQPNGVAEFTIGDDSFITYPRKDYGDGHPAIIAKYGTAGDLSTLTPMWNYPEGGMGAIPGGSRRYHVLQPIPTQDAAGKQGCYILNYMSGNGLALYLMAEEGFNAGVNDVVVAPDENAPVEYFNLQGIRVANPENGVFIRRQGATATKVVL